MQADLILYALVAAGLVFWLRSVLGTRHGDERERPNPFTAPTPEKPSRAGLQDPLPVKDVAGVLSLPETRPALPPNVTLATAKVEADLMELSRLDKDFNLSHFAQAAQDAFVMIVEAFAAGDRDTLKNLLEPSVYTAFDSAISLREKNGERVSTEIHAVRKADVLNVRIEAKTAYITIRFIADETCVVRDSANVILSGDPDRITEMNDIWTFSKQIRSASPIWLLHETRDGDVEEKEKTPLPESA